MEAASPRSPRMTMLEDVNRTVHQARDAARAREARQADEERRSASVPDPPTTTR